jgi:hypothetical protein
MSIAARVARSSVVLPVTRIRAGVLVLVRLRILAARTGILLVPHVTPISFVVVLVVVVVFILVAFILVEPTRTLFRARARIVSASAGTRLGESAPHHDDGVEQA